MRNRKLPHQTGSAVIAFACLFCLQVTLKAAPRQPGDRPNLIVIMVDDMGYAGVSCFGNPYFKTPQIDRLANEGMKFTDFHSSGTVCSPTRAGLLTGRYQQRAGIEAVIHPVSDHPEHRKGLRKNENTFAELLQSAGYRTGLIGKWHQGYPHNSAEFHPDNHGFDTFIGYHSGNIDFISHVGDHVKHDWWHGRTETREIGYSTHLINQYALQFIKENSERPFCLYVAHEAIHNPVQVPGDPVRRSEAEGWKRWRPANEAERIEKYKGMTLPIDAGVGQIRKLLEESGLDKNTFVLFFSDNGPARDFPSGSPKWRGGKGSVYEGGHRVPAIAWWPGNIKPASHTDQLTIGTDLLPTIMDLTQIDVPADRPLDGTSLKRLLLHQEPLPERPLFFGYEPKLGTAMRDGKWKMIVSKRGVELFDLSRDLGETTNLAASQPERAKRMQNMINQWKKNVGSQSARTPQQ